MKTIVYFALGGLAVAGTAYVLIKQNKKPILSTLDESNKISSPTSASSLTKPSTPSGTVGVNPKIEEPLKVFQTGYVAPKTTADNTVSVKSLEQVVKDTGAEGLAKALDEANRDRQAQLLLDGFLKKGTRILDITSFDKKRKELESKLYELGYKLVGGERKNYGGRIGVIVNSEATAIRV